MQVPHPIPYQGSKRRLAPQILRFFPNKKFTLYEPFAGSAAVSLAAAARGMVRKVVLNDANKPLMRLWERIIYQPKEVVATYRKLWYEQQGRERQYYDIVRDEFNRTQNPDLLLYLLARCVKASIRYNSNGEFNQSPDNRRRGARPETMEKHILNASQLLHDKTVVLIGDYHKALAGVTKDDLIYMDPPYQGVCGMRDKRYFESLPFDEFVDALRELNKQELMYIISYDGRTGRKQHGKKLPDDLCLTHVEIEAGVSSQYTLLGRYERTVESLYLSPALTGRIDVPEAISPTIGKRRQLVLF